MEKNLNNIFEIVDVDSNQIVIKVNADSTLKVAQFPFVSMEYDYITVTRGNKHILTIIKKDGSTFDFHWGYGGHTLISEGLERLKKSVMQFINESDILFEWKGKTSKSATIYFNSNYRKWQLTIDDAHYWSDTATSVNEMIRECRKFVISDWTQDIAPTGITIWKADNPQFCFR